MTAPLARPPEPANPSPPAGGAEDAMVAGDPPVLVRVRVRVSVPPSATDPKSSADGEISREGPPPAAPTMVTVATGPAGTAPGLQSLRLTVKVRLPVGLEAAGMV